LITGPTTTIEIISNAATLCGKAPFSTLDDGGDFALAGIKMFEEMAPELLSHPHWRFNVKTAQLQQIANFDPNFDFWQYAWQLPADYLSLVSLWPNVDFQIYGDRIYTLSGSAQQLSYRTQLPVSKWPSYFRAYATYELAIRLAFSVAESAGLETRLTASLVEKRAMALYVDAQNHPSPPIINNPWLSVRGGWY
jgi:hypothetical protein